MRLTLIRYLVTHTRSEREDTPILKLGLQFPLEAQQDVSFDAPMIRQVV
jgi:hypothetical protein